MKKDKRRGSSFIVRRGRSEAPVGWSESGKRQSVGCNGGCK